MSITFLIDICSFSLDLDAN